MFIQTELLDLLYDSCRVEYGVRDGDSPWCVALTPEDVRVLEYSEDLEYYWRASYPHDVSYEQACPLIRDMTTYFMYVDITHSHPGYFCG